MPALDRVTLVTPESLKEAIAGFGAPSDGRLGITEKKKTRVQQSSGNLSCTLL